MDTPDYVLMEVFFRGRREGGGDKVLSLTPKPIYGEIAGTASISFNPNLQLLT